MATLENTILANSPSSGDCFFDPIFGKIIDGGYNLASDDTCNLESTNHSHHDIDPGLGPLQYNGGPTQAHALLAARPSTAAITRSPWTPTGIPYHTTSGDRALRGSWAQPWT